MRHVILYIATSLDGKIAKADGSVEWLENIPNPEKIDHGYSEFLAEVDTVLMGYNTYEQVKSFGEWPYPDTSNYVFTRKEDMDDTEEVTFIESDPVEFIRELKGLPGKNIWLVGGGKLNHYFLKNHLIDQIRLFVMPVALGTGIGLFDNLEIEHYFDVRRVIPYSTGAVEIEYHRITEED
ncbi:MAG: dihydrofolate reductase family protein [Bacteroidota bacterium]|nr:dihydrofolate reductase family protein [Bacteroidota bacterium]MDX5449099.1 dihydrofolate reductase family protein [Bacteroidota bacterium]MDX5506509.1 dihydrofolate reductase family protein [Bacteroidota bacterium]